MTTTKTDRLVEDYVRRLKKAASWLPRRRRKELVEEIREHLDAALADTAPDDEIALRDAIERLGPPEEIVRAAGEPKSPRESGFLESAAIVALVLPGIGWLVGSALVALSRVWTAREKFIGVALAVAPAVFLYLAWSLISNGDQGGGTELGVDPMKIRAEEGGPFEFVFLLLTVLSGLPSTLYMGWRLHRHDRRAEVLSGTR